MSEREYFLMHKDIPVAMLFISEDRGFFDFRRIEANSNHFPIGGQTDDKQFFVWWKNRMIPKSRFKAQESIEKLGYPNAEKMMISQLCLSLNDCYWIKPRESSSTWKDVNLFSNDFNDVFGEINLGEDSEVNVWKLMSYNPATTQGNLPKKWYIGKEGKRYLLKNSPSCLQQNLNEIFASKLHFQLNQTNFLPYSLAKTSLFEGKEILGCQSACFTNENVELISFKELLQNEKFPRNEPLYFPLKNACLKLGIAENGFDDYMDKMILSDYLITNIDRHLGNMGILRNPDTLEILGFAPLYDFGDSMFYNLSSSELSELDFSSIKTNGFIQKEEKMLRYVKNKNCLDLSNLNLDFSIYDNDTESPKERYPLIKDLFERKLMRLKAFQTGRNSKEFKNKIENKENRIPKLLK